MEKVTFEEVGALFPAGIPMEAIQLCIGEHASADDLRNKLKALADTTMTNPQHEALVEAVARALYEADASFGYSFNLTRLVDGEETHTLSMPGFDPVDFKDDRDEGYRLIEQRRNLVRAHAILAALSATAATPSDEVVISEFAFLYRQYGLEKDENLAPDALELKRKVLAALEPHAKDL